MDFRWGIVNRIEKMSHFVRKKIQKRGKENKKKLVGDHDVTDKLKSRRFTGDTRWIRVTGEGYAICMVMRMMRMMMKMGVRNRVISVTSTGGRFFLPPGGWGRGKGSGSGWWVVEGGEMEMYVRTCFNVCEVQW